MARIPTARGKLAAYARAITVIEQRLAPVLVALRDAAVTDPDCAALWREIAERRAAHLLRFARDLRATGGGGPAVHRLGHRRVDTLPTHPA